MPFNTRGVLIATGFLLSSLAGLFLIVTSLFSTNVQGTRFIFGAILFAIPVLWLVYFGTRNPRKPASWILLAMLSGVVTIVLGWLLGPMIIKLDPIWPQALIILAVPIAVCVLAIWAALSKD